MNNIPENIEECFLELKKQLSEYQLIEIKTAEEDELVECHFDIAMFLRNNWNLWSNSQLAGYFNNLGISHPDDMSAIILKSFHRHLNNRDIQLEEQIKKCKGM